jgi:hypothetical protein
MKTTLCILALLIATAAFGQDCRETIMNEVQRDTQMHDQRGERAIEKIAASKKMTREQVALEMLNLISNDPEISRLQKERTALALKMIDTLPSADACPQLKKMAEEAKRINATQWDLIIKALERRK